MIKYIIFFIFFMIFESTSVCGKEKDTQMCNYQTWDWDVKQKKAINYKNVSIIKANLSKEEKGTIEGCSVCEEDQLEIKINNLKPFKVCKRFHQQIISALNKAINEGFEINTVIGYRVGKTKGNLDKQGKRTQFSNHSYGIAIDINSGKNGLYNNCLVFNKKCNLIQGGIYNPFNKGSITKESPIYKAILNIGFKWGGEIKGNQKDFMHFSIDGM